MLKFLFQRLVVLLAALLVVSILAFLIPYLSGPEPAQMIMHARVSDLAVDPVDQMNPARWRRVRDSNPRGGSTPPTRLAGGRTRPLCEPSAEDVPM